MHSSVFLLKEKIDLKLFCFYLFSLCCAMCFYYWRPSQKNVSCIRNWVRCGLRQLLDLVRAHSWLLDWSLRKLCAQGRGARQMQWTVPIVLENQTCWPQMVLVSEIQAKICIAADYADPVLCINTGLQSSGKLSGIFQEYYIHLTDALSSKNNILNIGVHANMLLIHLCKFPSLLIFWAVRASSKAS